jgi:hypothetical protein
MSVNTVQPPQIVGAKDPIDPIAERERTDVTMDTILHMDLPLQPAVELPSDVSDVVGLPTQEDSIMTTDDVNDHSIQTSTNATFNKTKRARKKMKVVEDLEGIQAAQGTPAPDILQAFIEEQRRQNTLLREMMKDLKTFRAETAPLQAEKLIPHTTTTTLVEDPFRPSDMIEQVTQATPAAVPITQAVVPQATSTAPFVAEQESYTNRFRKAFNSSFNMNTDAVNARARQQTGPATSSSAVFF